MTTQHPIRLLPPKSTTNPKAEQTDGAVMTGFEARQAEGRQDVRPDRPAWSVSVVLVTPLAA
jgi:hypothetical protein